MEIYKDKVAVITGGASGIGKCADVILKGVAKDKPIIPVTTLTHVVWHLARLFPIGVLKWIRKDFDKWRYKIRQTNNVTTASK